MNKKASLANMTSMLQEPRRSLPRRGSAADVNAMQALGKQLKKVKQRNKALVAELAASRSDYAALRQWIRRNAADSADLVPLPVPKDPVNQQVGAPAHRHSARQCSVSPTRAALEASAALKHSVSTAGATATIPSHLPRKADTARSTTPDTREGEVRDKSPSRPRRTASPARPQPFSRAAPSKKQHGSRMQTIVNGLAHPKHTETPHARGSGVAGSIPPNILSILATPNPDLDKIAAMHSREDLSPPPPSPQSPVRERRPASPIGAEIIHGTDE